MIKFALKTIIGKAPEKQALADFVIKKSCKIYKTRESCQIQQPMNPKARELEKKLENWPETERQTTKYAELLVDLGWEIGLEHPNRSFEISLEGRSICQELKYEAGLAKALRNIGYCYLLFSELDKSLEHTELAIEKSREVNDLLTLANALDTSCNAHFYVGRFDKALDRALQALRQSQEINFERGVAYGYHNLGLIYTETGELREARENLEKSLKLFQKLKYEPGQVWALLGLGNVEIKSEQYESALKHISQGLKLSESNQIPTAVRAALTNIGLIYQNLGEPSRAVEYHKNSMDALKELGGGFEAINLLNLGLALLDLNELEQAGASFEQALPLAQEQQLNPALFLLYEGIARVAEKKGDYKTALENHRLYHQHKEKIYNEESQSRIKDLQIRRSLEASEREAEIERLRYIEKSEAELREAHEEVKKLRDRLKAENVYLQEEIKTAHNFDEIVTASASVEKLLGQIEQAAPTTATVLILGESGTGKELLARAVHAASDRVDHPLVKLNCAALPENLIESELFGHEKGAFTGAVDKRIGRFELAHKGTLFLDEIGELPLPLQSKLLRVLQEGELERLGGNKTINVDVRIIAATNRDLKQEVKNGTFREDLYYRLNVFPVFNPPLRERPDDVPLLAAHFVKKYAAKMGKKIDQVAPSGLERLKFYEWPGNIRELENVIERAVILSPGPALVLDDALGVKSAGEQQQPTAPERRPTLKEQEQVLIQEALDQTGWVIKGKNGAAELLDVPASTLREKIKKYGLLKPG